MVIYIQYKYQKISFIGYLVMAEHGKKTLKFRQSKGNNSYHNQVQNLTMVIYRGYSNFFVKYVFYFTSEVDNIYIS